MFSDLFYNHDVRCTSQKSATRKSTYGEQRLVVDMSLLPTIRSLRTFCILIDTSVQLLQSVTL